MSDTRVRTHLHLDLNTGHLSETVEVLGPADFGQRARELAASLPADMVADPEATRIAQLVCDGCGQIELLDTDHPVYPVGWQERPDGDFCPECRS